MYLTSEESRNSLSDESIIESVYSVTTTDLISFKEEPSSPENNAPAKNRIRPKRKREKLDHLSNEEKVRLFWFLFVLKSLSQSKF